MIDCGKNSSTGWSPTVELTNRNVGVLDVLAITNFDEDHANGLPELRDSHIQIKSLYRAKNLEPDQVIQLKSEGGVGPGIASLVDMAKSYTSPLSRPIDFGNMTKSMFFNSADDFDDENNLSGVIILRANGRKVVFPGDVEKSGFEVLMQREKFREAIANATILIAPHHGRESSIHEGFLNCVRPVWTVISDCGYKYDTQQTVPTYAQYSSGGNFRGGQRKVLTTRKDGTISFNLG